MNILIPKKVVDDVDIFDKVEIKFLKTQTLFKKIVISKEHIRHFKPDQTASILVDPKAFEIADRIVFDINYGKEVINLSFFDKTELIPSRKKLAYTSSLRKNKDVIYQDTKEDKQLIMSLVDEYYALNCLESDEPLGTKNLLYYSIDKNVDYIPLLALSLDSIKKNTSLKNFEVLIITSENFKPLLMENKVIAEANPHLLIVDEAPDGVTASINKLRVFEFDKINEYKQVLFLDCDIICTGDLFKLLNSTPLTENELFVVCNDSVPLTSHESIFHGLDVEDAERLERIYKNRQMPFNAGQFMFKNSLRMLKHLETVYWFALSWPGRYFFEQCFMNRYFCGFNLTSTSKLNKKIELLSVSSKDFNVKVHSPATLLIHFISPPLEPVAKLNFINSYANAHKLKL